MSVVLSIDLLRPIFETIQTKPHDKVALDGLLKQLDPVIRLSCERFPLHLRDDMRQELSVAIMKKAPYIAEMFCAGKIANITNYVFRFLHNSAIIYFKRENTYATRFVSIEDLTIDKTVMPRNYKKEKVITRVREDVMAKIRARYTKKKDAARAERYVDVILSGKKPAFVDKNLRSFFRGRTPFAKEAYSFVLQEIRDSVTRYKSELLED